jgi:hypothetical protein
MSDEISIMQSLQRHLIPKEWDNAMCALQGHKRAGIGFVKVNKYDTKPLAKLLLSDEPVPPEVAKILGRLLNPPKTYIGGRLIFKPPGKQALGLKKRKKRDREAYTLLRKMIDEGSLYSQAVAEVAKIFNMSESAVGKLKETNDDEWFEEIKKRLDSGTMLP